MDTHPLLWGATHEYCVSCCGGLASPLGCCYVVVVAPTPLVVLATRGRVASQGVRATHVLLAAHGVMATRVCWPHGVMATRVCWPISECGPHGVLTTLVVMATLR